MKQLELQAWPYGKMTADKDWSLNNMNWLALSGAAPWSPPFFRVYHPARCSDDSLRGGSLGDFGNSLRRCQRWTHH